MDTGSPVCIISEGLFAKLVNTSDSLLSETSTTVHTADGSALKVKGTLKAKLKIGKLCVEQELIVANIEELSGILGMNFLDKNDVEIHVGKGLLVIKGQKITIKKEPNSTCAKVRLSDKICLPPQSEVLVDSYIDGKVQNDAGLVEGTPFVKHKGLMLAKTLINTESDTTCRLIMLNLNKKAIMLNENTVIGLVNEVSPVVEQNESKILDIIEHDTALPEHLQPLLENASDKLTETEKGRLKDLI